MQPRRTLFILLLLLAASCVDQKKEVEQYQKVLHAELLGGEPEYQPGQMLTVRQALTLANRQNERLAIDNYGDIIAFYIRLIRNFNE